MRLSHAIVSILLTAFTTCAAYAQMPHFQHVFVLVEENQSYDAVIGNTKDMPYLNSLAMRYGLATNYFADTHPSINNYFYLTAGRRGTKPPFFGILADTYPLDVDGPNIASILTAHHLSWKSYAESLPHAGYIGGNRGAYAKRHDPFAYFETVRDNKKQRANIVPFRQLKLDLQNHDLPNYGFIVPDLYHDVHNDQTTHAPSGCGDHNSLQRADVWLRENISPLINSPEFQKSGLLVITFDEACDKGPNSDSRFRPNGNSDNGGGHVATVVVSSQIPSGTTSDVLFHHESVLRSAIEALGLDSFPGRAAKAPDLSSLFPSNPQKAASTPASPPAPNPAAVRRLAGE